MKTRGRPPLWPGAAVALVTALAWSPVLSGRFLNWDDLPVVTANPGLLLRGWPLVKWAFTTTHNSAYQPLGWLLFALLRDLFGARPEPFHAFNLLAHSAAAFAAYALAWRLLVLARPSRPPSRPESLAAAFAALVFALHPANVELVAMASAPADTASAALVIAAVYLFSSEKGAVSLASTALAGLVRWLGALVFPAALSLGLYPLKAPARRALGPAALGVIPVLGMAWAKSARGFAPTGAPPLCRAAALFLLHWLLPFKLSPVYVLNRVPTDWTALLCALVTAAAYSLRRRLPALWPAWLFCLASIAPTTLMSEGGRFFYHDRYGYLAGLALALCLGGLLRAALEKLVRPRVLLGAGLLVAVLGLASFRQAGLYHDSVSLWRSAIDADPAESMAYNRLGEALADEQGRPCEALEAFRVQERLEDAPEARALIAQAAALCEAK